MGQANLYNTTVTLGCDPEAFLARDGQVIGAEKVIASTLSDQYQRKTVVLDGVQLELNPNPSTCRESLAGNIAGAVAAVAKKLEEKAHKGVSMSFEAVVRVDAKEMDTLSDKAKILGCAPSINLYKPEAVLRVPKNLKLMRSAGGHIHLGLSAPIYGQVLVAYKPKKNPYAYPRPEYKTVDYRKRLVPLLDTVVGNTSVLMDRNPLAAQRRKVYGKAGEFRLPAHGLEYRVLSNFWMRHYSLYSIVFGLARMCCQILATTVASELDLHLPKLVPGAAKYEDLESQLMSKVDLDLVRRAINKNDAELAKVTYKILREFLLNRMDTAYNTGVNGETVNAFDAFLDTVEKYGLEFWYPDDPFTHWLGNYYAYGGGELFLSKYVPQQLPGKLAVLEEYGTVKPWEQTAA